MRQVLDVARAMDLNICRAIAIRCFAGLRSSEVAKLQERDIRLEQGFIEVTAANAKTRRRLALNLLKREKTIKRGIKGKQLNAGWNHAYLLRLLET